MQHFISWIGKLVNSWFRFFDVTNKLLVWMPNQKFLNWLPTYNTLIMSLQMGHMKSKHKHKFVFLVIWAKYFLLLSG